MADIRVTKYYISFFGIGSLFKMIVYCFVFMYTRLLHYFEAKENYALKISQRNRRDLKIV